MFSAAFSIVPYFFEPPMKTGNVMSLTQVLFSISDPHSRRHKRHDLAELLNSTLSDL